jgi:serine protease Do
MILTATELSDSLANSVVEIRTPQGSGTGIIWSGGLIVSNAHCVPGSGAVHVTSGGKSFNGELLAHARDHDLALVRVPSIGGAPLEQRASATIRVGELVFAHGHPLGVRDSLAMGVVHAVARHPRSGEARFIVADIRLAPGNSGGPLVDAAGRLLGGNSMVMNGLGVAIPTDAVVRFIERALAQRVA